MPPNQQQAILEYFQNDAPILYFLLNENGGILSVNRYCQELLGESIVGHSFEELLIDFHQSFRLEDHINNRHALLSFNVPNSLPKSFILTFHKVDDCILVFGKNDAEELELLRSELLHVNQELNNLTRSLHKKNAQLAHLNTLKNQFLGMAAHDLRKPISVILNYSEFLLDEVQDQLNEEHIGFIKTIERSSLFMKRLVDDFLDVSVIESGGFQLNLKPTNPADILKRSLVLARIQANKKGVGLEVEIEHQLPEILLDGDKIEQAMSNLLSNAIEHSDPGKCVSIALKEVDGKVSFSVIDRGTGMSPEVMKQLFTPFSQARSVKTGGEKSTGLGLTITRKIVDAHKGKIVAESEKGCGTVFTIIFESNA